MQSPPYAGPRPRASRAAAAAPADPPSLHDALQRRPLRRGRRLLRQYRGAAPATPPRNTASATRCSRPQSRSRDRQLRARRALSTRGRPRRPASPGVALHGAARISCRPARRRRCSGFSPRCPNDGEPPGGRTGSRRGRLAPCRRVFSVLTRRRDALAPWTTAPPPRGCFSAFLVGLPALDSSAGPRRHLLRSRGSASRPASRPASLSLYPRERRVA